MKHWAPKPLMNINHSEGLFPIDDTVTIVKKSLTPIERQRRLDGTPHTFGALQHMKPQGPALYLGEEKLSKGQDEKSSAKPSVDPDAVIKSYFEHNDK